MYTKVSHGMNKGEINHFKSINITNISYFTYSKYILLDESCDITSLT